MQTEIKKRRKVEMDDVVTTLSLRRKWAIESIAEVLFELYRWMYLSASQKIRSRKSESERYDGLKAFFESSGTTWGDDWRDKIAERILSPLLDHDPMIVRWRREQKIATAGTVTLTLPTSSYNQGVAALLDKMSAFRGRTTKVPMNRQHPEAVMITNVRFGLSNGKWGVWSMCGVGLGKDKDEWWCGSMIQQKDGETFYDFITRALAETEAMLRPPCPTRSAPINNALACFVGFTGTDKGTGREVVGGVAVDDVFGQIELPAPVEGDAFRFKGERSTIWQSPTLRRFQDANIVELQEDFWVLLPGAMKPSRLLVAKCDDTTHLIVETSWKHGNVFGFGSGGNGGSWSMILEHSAKRARARLMLYQDMYRRGFLLFGWKEHQALKVDGILHPFPGEEQSGRYPRQKADAEQFCHDVRPVMYQHYGDLGPVMSRTSCVTGYEDGWHGDGEVRVGGEL